ncbi:MAG TPA: phospholipase D-like domain-containing protein, partial [Elusimicrobiales bacterium]|nr:phospholipase D-like domain-containing protein [Elusimicrobiales bacterium]
MKKIGNYFLLLLLTVFPVLSQAGPALETLTSARPPAPVPAASAPAYLYPGEKGGYDLAGLPAYIFTEEERVSPALVTAIDRTKSTLDVALYNLQFEDTIQAMLRAKARGVKVRVIFDYDHVYPKAGTQIQEVINSGLETRVMKGRAGSGSMHCKYAIFDGALLETGSANWSNLAEAASYENLMFVSDPDVIRGYAADYEWMWAQARPAGSPDAPAAKPTAPPADPRPSIQFNGATLPKYIFSPRAGTTAAMAKAIDAARSEVDVAMFSFTSRPLMDALNRAAVRGVKVKLLLYVKSNFPFKEEARTNKIQVHYKGGRTENGIMHNKFMIIDANSTNQ